MIPNLEKSQISSYIFPVPFGQVPNGTGEFANLAMQDKDATPLSSGCFNEINKGYGGFGTLLENSLFDGYSLDLSVSNAIYGASNKVQPKATQLLIIIKT